ncbi:MAG: hypothetical protein K0U72_11430 [Gammaproteobacteria bacterium]|nr:hypothetical protein [Gammaproteobacteria bacterium]
MSDRNQNNLPFESDDRAEQKLWSNLRELPEESPSADLRRGFYKALDDASSDSFVNRFRQWLGFGSNTGWLTAAACTVLGFGIANVLHDTSSADPDRLAMLEENVQLLNRELILDRLEDPSAGTRLKGVFDASAAANTDEQIVRALLQRATADRVPSIRTAAIDALGPNLSTASVGDELMSLLENSDSPTVQLALVDLVLRNGTGQQLQKLLELAHGNRLHPDLVRHVMKALGSETA